MLCKQSAHLLYGRIDGEAPPDVEGAERVVDHHVAERDEVDAGDGDGCARQLHRPLRHRRRLT